MRYPLKIAKNLFFLSIANLMRVQGRIPRSRCPFRANRGSSRLVLGCRHLRLFGQQWIGRIHDRQLPGVGINIRSRNKGE